MLGRPAEGTHREAEQGTKNSRISSDEQGRKQKHMRTTALILAQIGSTDSEVVTAPRLRHGMQPDHPPPVRGGLPPANAMNADFGLMGISNFPAAESLI